MPKYVCEAFATPEELLAVVCEGDLDEVTDADLIQEALDDAADALYLHSGQRFYGVCERTVRPCRDSGCWDSCSCCCNRDGVALDVNAIEIVSVKIDGVTLDEATYTISYDGWTPMLVKLSDDERPTSWPGCQKLYRPSTEEDTFEIVYNVGHPVSLTERNANIELALGIIASQPGRTINLVQGATSISGGGVVIVMDPNAEGQAVTIPSVRRFMAVWNPREDRTFSAAWSPDLASRC